LLLIIQFIIIVIALIAASSFLMKGGKKEGKRAIFSWCIDIYDDDRDDFNLFKVQPFGWYM